jgi:transcriptional regulator with GAF, ATPase, and Fis domain/tetratricopeptide (TPR) repeat protein
MNQPSTGASPRDVPASLGALTRQLTHVHSEARRNGHGALVVLHAPYGTGFESLLKEWRRSLLGSREPVFEGTCRGGRLTYRPLREVLSRYVRNLDDLGLLEPDVQALVNEVGGSLGMPGLRGMAVEPAPVESSAVAQLRFFEAVGHLFAAASERLPAVVVIHEMQDCDSATNAALNYLLEYVFSDPVAAFAPSGSGSRAFQGTVVVTVCEQGDALNELRRRLGERPHVHFLDLRPFEEERVRQHLTRDDVVARLMNSAGGSVEQLDRLIDGLAVQARTLFEQRLESLADDERRLLDVLAVLGRPASPELALQLAGVPGRHDLLSRAVAQGLLDQRIQRTEVRLDFVHAAQRDLLYEQLSPERRSELHGAVARVLEDRSRLGEAVDPESIAAHDLKGPSLERATQSAWAAIDHLQRTFAYQRAADLLRSLRQRSEPDAWRAIDTRLAVLQSALGDQTGALATLGALWTGAASAEQVDILFRSAEIRLELGQFADALLDAERISEMNLPLSAEEQWRLHAVTAEARYGRGEHDAVLAMSPPPPGIESAEPSLIRQWIRVDNTIGKVLLFLGRYEEADEAFARNGDRAARAGFAQEEVRSLFNRATLKLQQRRYVEAEQMLQRCVQVGGEMTSLVTRSFLQLNLGVIYHKTLRYAEALQAYLSGLALFRRSGSEHQYAVTAMNLGSLYENLGDAARARALIATALDITGRRDILYFRARALFVLGNLELNDQRYDRAVAALEEARDLIQRTGGGAFAGRVLVSLARAADGASNRELRQDLLEQVYQLAAEQGGEWAEVRAEADLAAGYFALRDGNPAGAMEPLRQALLVFEQNTLHERTWQARLYLGLGTASEGDHDHAHALLKSAATLLHHMAQNVPDSMRETFFAERTRRKVFESIEALESGRTPWLEAPMRAAEPDEDLLSPQYLRWRSRYASIVGEDPRLRQIFRMVDRISESDSTVLIQGESGTGKELIAASIHQNSKRSQGAFVKVNCAAFVETLLLSELFGHERGAFTGAMARKKGRFELADGGTLFLDEIGDISPNTQVALLRVLQERTFERVGGSETVETDVRLICATNRNLEEMVRNGSFRLDLYYRLKGFVIELPRLSDRRADIPLLVEYFCSVLSPAGWVPKQFSREAMALLVRYSWPGNIRELENFVRSILLFVDGERIELSHIRQFDDFFADGEFLPAPPPFFDDWARRRSSTTVTGVRVPAGQLSASGARQSGTTATSGEFRAVPSPPGEVGSSSPATSSVAATPSAAGPASGQSPEAWMARWAIDTRVGLHELKHRLEVEAIRQALIEAKGNITQAAVLLDMKRPRLSQIVNAEPELRALRAGGDEES